MTIDHNIYLQAAALKQKDRELMLNSLKSGIDSNLKAKELQVEREKASKTGFDLEKLAQQTQIKKEMGIQTTPEEDAAFNTFLKFAGAERAMDPTTGSLYPKFDASSFGSPPFVPSSVPGAEIPKGFNFGALSNPAVNTPYEDIEPLPMDLASMEQALQGTPVANQAPVPPPSGQRPPLPGLNTDRFAPRVEMPTLPVNNPKARQDAAEKTVQANIALQQKEGEADIDASAAGAKKRNEVIQESEANKELKIKGLSELRSNLEQLIADAEGTPSGVLEGLAATASEKLGKPNPQAVRRARFSSGAAITGLQTRIEFLKGQGTITDSEAKQAMSFIPSPDEATEIKKEKLKGGLDYINSLIGEGAAPPPNAPGFRYIGRKQ